VAHGLATHDTLIEEKLYIYRFFFVSYSGELLKINFTYERVVLPSLFIGKISVAILEWIYMRGLSVSKG
jgi:hypothetical protein